MIATTDERAKSLLRDLSMDPLAREIIKRVDSSPYGSKTHKRGGSGGVIKSRSSHNHAESEPGILPKIEGDSLDLHSTQ